MNNKETVDLVEEEISQTTIEDLIGNQLIVFNDEVNSFEWVIECFVKYLKHAPEQAEQCAIMIHQKGKYAVKHGTKEELEPIKTALCDAGLSAEIQ